MLLTGHDHDLAIGYDGKTVMVESNEEGNFVTAVDFTVDIKGEGKDRKVSWTPSFRVHDSMTVEPDPEVAGRRRGAGGRALPGARRRRSRPATSSSTAAPPASARRRRRWATSSPTRIRAATKADCAITNGGGIRANKLYPAGAKLTRRDVLTELPFGNTTVLVEITGADIKAALENGVSLYSERAGRFPQVSGLRFAFDAEAAPSARASSRSRSTALPLDPARRYKVASNNFMLAGGDGYDCARRVAAR